MTYKSNHPFLLHAKKLYFIGKDFIYIYKYINVNILRLYINIYINICNICYLYIIYIKYKYLIYFNIGPAFLRMCPASACWRQVGIMK